METRTKIVCTIGPAVDSDEAIDALISAGMSVARLNCSHSTHEMLGGMIRRLKHARQRANKPLAICMDTRGPKIRVGKLAQPELKLVTGQHLRVQKEPIEGSEEGISVSPANVLDCVNEGSRILFDDGYIISRVVSKDADGVVVRIQNDGILRPGKGVNIPNEKLPLPAMTDKDREDIIFGCENDIDLIAASFIRKADDIMAIKKVLEEHGHPEILVIAKIENAEGVQNFDTIIQAADGVMIARGDLGVEVPISQVPRLQKMMIRKSYLAGKPSVTATQMLESMINNPRPTRAEVSDVANAIYDGTSAVMLSGETAVGRYPIEVVNVMRSVILEAESDFQNRQFLDQHANLVYHDVPSAVTLATVKTAYSSRAKAIFAFTRSGSTARLLSRLRPSLPILAMTPKEKSYHQMAVNWGVTPILSEVGNDFDEAYQTLSHLALDMGLVSYGDLVIVTAGSPFGVSGTTNTMVVENIGDVLVRGQKGRGSRVHGNVAILMSPESREPFTVRNQILVIPKCDPTYQPFVANALAVVLHNHVDDTKSEAYLLDLATRQGKPAIVRADGATAILKEGQLVTVDPDKALVYKGVVLQ
ncbi:MAG: pyruvate kinase [Chlamydiales bacterium]|nr:pyruvate kinase [Chlamydiales bacterium]